MNSAAWAGDRLPWTVNKGKERKGQREGIDIRIAVM